MTAPRQTTASNRPHAAIFLAMSGNSNEPGTQATVTSESCTPHSASAALAPASSRDVTNVIEAGDCHAYPQTVSVERALYRLGHSAAPVSAALRRCPILVRLVSR